MFPRKASFVSILKLNALADFFTFLLIESEIHGPKSFLEKADQGGPRIGCPRSGHYVFNLLEFRLFKVIPMVLMKDKKVFFDFKKI